MRQQKKSHNDKYKNTPKPGGSASLKNYEDLVLATPLRFYTEKEEPTTGGLVAPGGNELKSKPKLIAP